MVVSSTPAAAISVGWYSGMDDRLRAGKPPRYVTSHPGQLSLLPSVGREMSTGKKAAMSCGWRVKAGWLIQFVDKRVGGMKNCDPFNTCHPEHFREEFRS